MMRMRTLSAKSKEKVAVVGAGSWGTALAMVLAAKCREVVLWGHDPDHLAEIDKARENSRYLPGYPLAPNIVPTCDLGDAVSGCQVVVMVVPSHGFRKVYEELVAHLDHGCCVVSAVKGIENASLMTMTQVMEDVRCQCCPEKMIIPAVLSGPSFALEVAQGLPTAVTIGCEDPATASRLQQLFGIETFRVYTSRDVIGLEISGALKNIVAVAAGICDGLGYGLNTRAALITRGLTEIMRLGVAMGAEPATFSGLSGLGDLVLTCTGSLSRNRNVGLKLGKGEKLEDIVSEMQMVAEGVKTTKSGYELARKMGIEMPILEQVYAILYQDKKCDNAVRDLLRRELKVE